MKAAVFLPSLIVAIGGLRAATPMSAPPLSRADRLAAHTVIERFWFEYRIWPKENPTPKPPFEEMVKASFIQLRSDQSLQKSIALKRFWDIEISPVMLQAEMDRVVGDTKEPGTLRDLFTALGNDPRLIAETLIRDLLTERLIRQRYGFDSRLHTPLRAQAETIARKENWGTLAGGYTRETFVIARSPGFEPTGEEHVRTLPADDFERMKQQAIRKSESASIKEDAEGISIQRSKIISSTVIESESLFLPKTSFNTWWENVAKEIMPTAFRSRDNYFTYRMPVITATTGCDQWSSMSTTNAPAPRGSDTAVWTGAEMIIWGGALNTGGRYNPATDSWTPTSTGINVPQPRYNPTAVWTGTEMIVWGGWLNSGSYIFFNSGGRYNPSSDNWTPTSLGVNLPDARLNHSAIWTGSEMNIWGGRNCSTFRCTGGWDLLNSGGRYNPSADVWTSTSIGSGVPSARIGHSAIWSGNGMIVWSGGGTGSTCTNTGGLYNPVLDQWNSTSLLNAPNCRWSHSAVWTDNEMIVWGGWDGSNSVNSGGQYSPSQNTWSFTTIDPMTPVQRSNHSGIWNGNELIIWGGYTCAGSCTFFNDGGRYNRDNKLWSATALIGAPSSRNDHHAVWTGNRMIIWEGYDPAITSYTNTGGIYSSGSAPSPANTLRGSKSTSVNLTWSRISGAGSYNVKRCDPTATGCIPSTIVSTPTINQYSEPNDALSHFYAIEAVNACGATP